MIGFEAVCDAAKKIWALEIDLKLKKQIMDLLVWRVTVPKESLKYKQKYRSDGARNVTDEHLLHHEHVVSRKILKEELVNAKSAEEVESILRKVEACIVTRAEHKILKNKGEGWKRYQEAGIAVWDVSGKEHKRHLPVN